MKQNISVFDEILSYFNAVKDNKENATLDKELKELLSKLNNVLKNIHDENSYKNNYLMVRLKKETKIGYQAIEKLIEIKLVEYNGKHFDFRCEKIGVIGSFFAHIKFKKPLILSEYVTHKGNPVAPITFTNGGKISPTREWRIIEEMLNNLNLTPN